MVGPSAGQDERRQGAGALMSTKEFDAVAQFGVVHLAQRVGAKVVRGRGRGQQLVFGVGFLDFLDFGCGNVGRLGAQAVIEADDVDDEMRETHLIGRGLVAEFVGGHGGNGAEDIGSRARQQYAQAVVTGSFTGAAACGVAARLLGACPEASTGDARTTKRNVTRKRFIRILLNFDEFRATARLSSNV